MTRRRRAYFSALKFHFQDLINGDVDRYTAWRLAKTSAATYAFEASTDHLTFVTL